MLKSFRATMSGFAQILKHVNRWLFDDLVKKHKHDKGSKGFSSWAQFTGMAFAQLSGCDSLRAVENAFESFQGELNHIGI